MDTIEPLGDPAEMRARATRWRKLAALMTDRAMIKAIIEQAEGVEAMADLIDGKGPIGPKP